MIWEFIAGVFMLLGATFVLLSSIGLLKFPDIFMRMSATTKTATFGAGLLLLGTVSFFQDIGVTSRAIIIILFLFLTAPVAAHLIGRAAYHQGARLWGKSLIDELGKDLKNGRKTPPK